MNPLEEIASFLERTTPTLLGDDGGGCARWICPGCHRDLTQHNTSVFNAGFKAGQAHD